MFKGTWSNRAVAVKQARLEQMTKDDIKEFMREVGAPPDYPHETKINSKATVLSQARVMRMLNSPYCIQMYGVCAATEPLMLIMELVRQNG